MASNVRLIAKKAGVSTATVSRVIHRSDKVRPETCMRVENVIKELGIDSDKLIRSKKNKSCVIGVVVPDLTNAFFSQIIAGIEEIAAENGISLFICNTKESDRREIHYLRLLNDAQAAGVIITPASDDDDSVNNEYLNLLDNMKIPVVLVDRDVKYSHYDGVFIDNEKGAFDAVRLLLQNGHRKIAIISGPENTMPGRDRLKGYRMALEMMNVPAQEDLIFEGSFSIESGRIFTEKILKEKPEVTAIFCSNNLMTLGCLAALAEAGIHPPEGMALVGFDEITALAMLGTKLTVVNRPTVEMGRQAMLLMQKALDASKAPQKRKAVQRIVLPTELIIRGSEKQTKNTENE